MSEPRPQAPEPASPGVTEPTHGAPSAPEPTLEPAPASLASPELADLTGAVMSRPEVLEARAQVVAARESFGSELSTLKSTARASLDPRVRVAEAAQGITEDPKRAIGAAAAIGGGILGLRFLRGRKAKPPTTLPPEVADSLAGMGKDGEAVRAALDRTFTRYLQEHGAAPATRSKLPRGLNVVILPIAGQIGREVVRQAFKRRDPTMAADGSGPTRTSPPGPPGTSTKA
jgi:hypothetical protein